MASYHCSVKVGGKGKAAAHAAYISREGKYSDSPRYEDLECSGYGNMPKWAEHNPAHFWQSADEYERANGATYREIEVALPRELTPDQRRELVEDFVQNELGKLHAYQWAIHTPKAALEGAEQPHAHIMYSERTNDEIERDPSQYFKRYNAKNPERGGCKKDSAGTEERLLATRQSWAEIQNEHLARYGHAARVDHRSLKEQGIDREPEFHLGGIGVRKLAATDISALLVRRAAEGELERANRAVGLIDVSGNLALAKAEREQKQSEEAQASADKIRLENEVRDFARQATAQFKQDLAAQALAEQRAQAERQALEAAQRVEQQRQRLEQEKQRQLDEKKQALREAAIQRVKDLKDVLLRHRVGGPSPAVYVNSETIYAEVALDALKAAKLQPEQVDWKRVDFDAASSALQQRRPQAEVIAAITACSPRCVNADSAEKVPIWVAQLAAQIEPQRKPKPEPTQDQEPPAPSPGWSR
ncbi:MobA/MobL family protein (plasmid) [Deefgea piscis]|uniref:MobA/MobL family protein n=1 Tax=Deefgea piscis TaxID=2739061 RepID=A0A6M8SW76_9NEIS|nr:MobA/MobL family protein [Deefgea piscis]QKJ68298.1 MobA/MobL family protein [Deefgea piscis]